MPLKRPNIDVGDRLSVFLSTEDAESDQQLDVEIVDTMPMCWHYVAKEPRTGQYYSLFVASNGMICSLPIELTYTEPGEDHGDS